MADPSGWTSGPTEPVPGRSGPSRGQWLLVALIAVLALTVVGGTIALVVQRVSRSPDVAEAPADPPEEPAPPQRGGGEPRSRQEPIQRKERRERKDRGTGAALGRPAKLGGLAQQVSEVREIPLRGRLRSRALSPTALANKVSDLAFSEQDPEEVANNERLLVALRLAPTDIDLAGILEDLYREQVIGLYVPEEKTLYVGQQGEATPGVQTTTAHEITHALQDRAFDMVELQERYEDDADASLAVLSLIEGDAVLTQQLWAQKYLTTEQQQQAAMEGGGGGEALARAPEYLRASLFFPYSRGGFFVADLYRAGGHDAVDEAFRNPPTSSEHILHPDRYRAGDDPADVDVEGRPGAGWEPATTYAFGEFDLRELFGPLGAGTASSAGEGWGGGEVRSWSKGEATAVATVLAFDTAGDADEVCAAVPQWYAEVADGRKVADDLYEGDRDHLALSCSGDEVAFALAPSPQTARRLTVAP